MEGIYQSLLAMLCHHLNEQQLNELIAAADSILERDKGEMFDQKEMMYYRLLSDMKRYQRERPHEAERNRLSNAAPIYVVEGAASFFDGSKLVLMGLLFNHPHQN